MAVLRRFARSSGGPRATAGGSTFLAGVAAPSASLLALPAPEQAGSLAAPMGGTTDLQLDGGASSWNPSKWIGSELDQLGLDRLGLERLGLELAGRTGRARGEWRSA
jgi:hypothetical protein